jgi:hypothetical protein
MALELQFPPVVKQDVPSSCVTLTRPFCGSLASGPEPKHLERLRIFIRPVRATNRHC